jgi:tetratricopeptide (TPR) repeat protein
VVTPLPVADLLVQAEQHRVAGRLVEAEAACRQALDLGPDVAEAFHILGLVAYQSGRLDPAIEHLGRAVSLAADHPVYRANLAEMYRLAGRTDDAVREGRLALELKPDYPEALSNLGIALFERKEYGEAADCHRRAVALNPGFVLAHSNLGNALFAIKQYDEAAAAYRRAIAIDPDFADPWANLGTTLHHAGEFDEAVSTLRRALALDPHHANARSGLGILLLMRGEFGEGWDEYEWRLQSSEVQGPRFPQRPWQGESLAGRHIYVQAEQGFGDALQFARYLPMVAERAGAVTFVVQRELVGLMRENLPGVVVRNDLSTQATADCEAALVSLPRLFRTRYETIPAPVPYLHPPAEYAARWRQRLSALKGFKVGIAWAGNPGHANDFRRSLALETLAPLLAVPGAAFVSLQVGPRAADLVPHDGSIADLSSEITDFSDSAGIVAGLDLVITVDSAVAHLAGALGKPTWVLLPVVSDWRWLLQREDNPWYPTMRLFRQQQDGLWPPVIGRVAAELAAVIAGDATRLAPFQAEGERRAARAAETIAVEATRAAAPPAAAQPVSAQSLIVAEQYRRAGQLAKAEHLSRAVLSAQPGMAEAAHSLGLIAYQSGKLDQAIEHLRRAIALDDAVAHYHANLGEMLRLAGYRQEAITHGRRALALKPDYPAAQSNLGIALFEDGRYEEALACYDRAIALDSKFAEAYSNRGNALRALKRFAEAEAAYRRALKLKPDFADGWNNLGAVLRDLKRPREAEQAYRKARSV